MAATTSTTGGFLATTGGITTGTTTGSTTGILNGTTGIVTTGTTDSAITADGTTNEELTVFLSLIGSIMLVAIVTKMLHQYANWRKTPWYALVTTWANWFMAVSIVLLIPVDVSSSLHSKCLQAAVAASTDGTYDESCTEPWIHLDREALTVIWNIIYWVTYVECWVIVPIMQSYVLAGHFHWHQRMIRAVKENLLIYAAGAIIGVILIIFLVIKEGINTKDQLLGVAMAASNAYGLAIVIGLLGYGLVEVPRKLWRKSDREGTLRYYRYKAFLHLEQFEAAEKELQTAMKLVKKYDDAVKTEDEYRKYMDVIVTKCPLNYKEITRGEGDLDLEYSKLVSLHNRIIAAVHNFNVARSLYEMNLKRSWNLEDVVNSEGSRTKTISWTFKTHKWPASVAPHLAKAEWFWKTHLETWGYRILTVILAILSFAVVWSETMLVVPRDKARLSIFYWTIAKPHVTYAVQWVLCFVPICYISYCAYWSLFQLRIFNFYRIVPKNSDANSILFSAYYLARIIPSMTYNFLFLIDSDVSVFEKVLGSIKLTALGYDLNFFFPLALFLLCGGNFFNLFSKFFYSFAGIFKCCWKINRYDFEEDWNDERSDKGKDIIAKEREFKKRGQGLSIDMGISLLRETPKEKVAKVTSSILGKFNLGRKKNASVGGGTTPRGEKDFIELEQV